MDENIKPNSLQAWVLAARPKTLTAASIPVMIGCALAEAHGHFQLVPAILCFLFAFLMQIDANFINDWGDILVLVFFGFVPVGCTYYVMAHTWNLPVTIASLASGLVIDTLLMVNNFRDREQDKISGKRTLVVRFGAKTGLITYFFLGFAACWCCFYFLGQGKLYASLLPQIYLLLHILTTARMARIGKGKALNIILGETSRNMFLFGLLLSIGLVI